MAPRTRLTATLDPAKVEHAPIRTSSGSVGRNTLLVTGDADDAAASAAAAAASAAAAVTTAAAAAASAAAALASENAAELAETNAETAETNAETAETNAETAETNAEAAQAAAEAALATMVAADYMPKAGGTFTGGVGLDYAGNAVFSIFGGAAGFLRMGDKGAGANLKYYDAVVNDGTLSFRSLNDDTSTKNTPLTLNADNSVSLASALFAGSVGAGNGYARVNPGHASGAGWVGWYNSSGNRLGYMGDSNTNIHLALENSAIFQISGGAVQLPSWTTATRPASPQDGYIGRNSDTGQIEFYHTSIWRTLFATPGVDLKWNEATPGAAVDIRFPANSWGMRIRGLWMNGTTGANLLIRTSADFSSFASGASDYVQSGYFLQEGSTLSGANTGTSTSLFAGAAIHVTTLVMPFELTITSGGSGQYPHIVSHSHGFNAGANGTTLLAEGYRNSTASIGAGGIRLLASSGNIAAMRYHVEPI